MRASPALLWLRAGVLAIVCLVAGTAAHVTAMGSVPGPAVLGLLLGVTTGLAALLLRRPARRGRVVALTVAGQLWVHLGLALTAGHPTGHASGHGGPSMAAMPPMSPGTMLLEHVSGAQAPMLVLHLLAAGVVGLWLARGERLLWELLSALGGAVLALVRLVPIAPLRPSAPVPPRSSRPLPVHLAARCVVRRGPPSLLAG